MGGCAWVICKYYSILYETCASKDFGIHRGSGNNPPRVQSIDSNGKRILVKLCSPFNNLFYQLKTFTTDTSLLLVLLFMAGIAKN